MNENYRGTIEKLYTEYRNGTINNMLLKYSEDDIKKLFLRVFDHELIDYLPKQYDEEDVPKCFIAFVIYNSWDFSNFLNGQATTVTSNDWFEMELYVSSLLPSLPTKYLKAIAKLTGLGAMSDRDAIIRIISRRRLADLEKRGFRHFTASYKNSVSK